MNFCIISLQAILVAVLLAQYHYTVEVEASNPGADVGSWFNSVEKTLNVKGVMSDVIGKLREAADQISRIPRRLVYEHKENTVRHVKQKREEVNNRDLLKKQEQPVPKLVADLDATGASVEKDDSKPTHTTPAEMVHTKKKKRGKKHKKKKAHVKPQNSSEKEETSTKKSKKEHKKKVIKRRFNKVMEDGNNSDSEEGKRRQPVDIIVHIKMNE